MRGDIALSETGGRRAVIRAAALWLAFLAPFFYLTYGTANWLASQRDHVPDLAFGWERHIPFIAWSIVPYWSINAFYAPSLFVNDTPQGVGRLAKRYLTAQIVAVACFLAFPLQAIFVRPETHGLPGFLFDVLGGFDKPFNQAPSLHIALLVIIWHHLRSRVPAPARLVWDLWCILIGVSVLTTWQHHVIDIPTGALLGLFALWLFPADAPSPAAGFRFTQDPKARRLALYYAFGAAMFLALTALLTPVSGAAMLFLWPALSLALVAFGYAGAGAAIFQKDGEGRVSLASVWLLAPYRLGACVNVFLWTRALPASVEIADGVHLGRFPKPHELKAYSGVIDMTGEFRRPNGIGVEWRAFPSLDLLPAPKAQLGEATAAVEEMRARGPVLVCCALGFQRSAATVAAWLQESGRAATAHDAAAQIEGCGRPVHLSREAVR